MEVRKLTMNDLNDLMELQSLVYGSLQDKMILETIDRPEFIEMIEQDFIIGVYEDQNLKAVRAMYIPPPDDPEHLAEDAGIEDRSEVTTLKSLLSIRTTEDRVCRRNSGAS